VLPFQKVTMLRILLVLLAVSAIGGGYFFLEPLKSRYQENRLLSSDRTEAVGQDARLKVEPDTEIVQKMIYLKCNDEEIIRDHPTSSLIGLNQQQIQHVYSGWSIDKFDSGEIVLTLKVDGYCPEHANNMFLGIQDGYVAVFRGKPGPRAILKEVTGISVANLAKDDVDELGKGLTVNSREELLRVLEGMQSK